MRWCVSVKKSPTLRFSSSPELMSNFDIVPEARETWETFDVIDWSPRLSYLWGCRTHIHRLAQNRQPPCTVVALSRESTFQNRRYVTIFLISLWSVLSTYWYRPLSSWLSSVCGKNPRYRKLYTFPIFSPSHSTSSGSDCCSLFFSFWTALYLRVVGWSLVFWVFCDIFQPRCILTAWFEEKGRSQSQVGHLCCQS